MLKNKVAYILLGIILVGGAILLATNKPKAPSPTSSPNVEYSPAIPSALGTSTSVNSDFFYPMTQYDQRLTVRWFGKEVTLEDRESLPCGYPYEDIHTADDLEVFPSEINQDVPVYAIADGRVRQVEAVNGYGGLIVIEHTLNDKPVTVYYGHIDLSQTTLKENNSVKAGQRITVLGDNCSPEAGNERKHLHFGIHNDAEIDVRGYVDSTNELNDWIDPKNTLSALKAKDPEPN